MVYLFVLILMALFALLPFFFMLVSSFKPGAEIIKNGINTKIELDVMSFRNYFILFKESNGIYLDWYKNSVIITGLHTVISVFLCALVGYGLAMYEFKGKNLIFVLVLVLLMVPIEILILPLYKLSVLLHIIDTYAGVILPFVVSPVAIFFFRQFAIGLPRELLDAGRIDGCSEFGIFFRIMMPLMKPAFGAMVILQAMFSWNAFVWPLIVLRTNTNFTLPIGLASLITPYGNSYDMLFSGAVASVVPIIIIFLFNQKSFISGLTVGGVKG
ncbi:ABC transporter permease subunit [Iocasia frigidifontis]|uniref:ABC transporter permease subunit n=1 Tax=Iocasia fonsfrigidae TaxID=2682810 RepID=A0A8A7KMI9_9FIRM|nr:ABC transporter permease subunit [Iocasia fonsfrigidae]